MEEVLTRRLTAYLAERDKPATRSPGTVLVPAAAAARRRRQGPAQRGGASARGARARARDPGGGAREAVRRGVRARSGATRSGSRASPRRCTCCSESATRRTASRSRFHRELRGKRMTKSVLDDIPGLGPTRRSRLVKELGGVEGGEDAPRSRRCVRCRGCPTPSPMPSTPRSTCRPPARDRERRRERRALGGHARLVAGRLHRRRRPGVRRSRSFRSPPTRLGGARRACSTSARGEGQVSRLAVAAGASFVVGVDPTAAQVVVAAERGGGPLYGRAGGVLAAVRGRRASTRWSRASCSSTSTRSTTRSPRWRRVLVAGGRFALLPQPSAAANAEQRLDRRPGARSARAVLAHRRVPGRGPRRSRRSRRASSSRSSTGRSAAT